MCWEKTKLGSILKIQTGKYDVNHSVEDGPYPFYTCALKPFKANTCSFDGDLIMLPGNGANVGEVMYYSGKIEAYQRTYVLHEIKADPKYVFYYLKKFWRKSLSNKQYGSATNYIRLDNITSFQIPLPKLSTQNKIALILESADALRKKDQQLLAHYDALLQSIFYDMFGDSALNTAETKKYFLGDIADIVSGVAKNENSIKEDFVEVPYMRVANVQDSHIVLKEVKKIRVSIRDFNKFLLKPNDILLTEGGDPDKLGRGAVWHNEIAPCIHQNHIFRVRVDPKIVNPVFLSFQIGSKYGKSYFLKAAKQTTGIASINLTQLKNFVALIPSVALQNRFAAIAKNIEQQKEQIKKQLQHSEALFQSLLQKAFNGELIK